jgi:hypothetical protein
MPWLPGPVLGLHELAVEPNGQDVFTGAVLTSVAEAAI